MKKIVAINCSPRTAWNTAALVREAAKGAESQGAEVQIIDLYKLEKFTGCVSCFGCKLPENLGRCICRSWITAPITGQCLIPSIKSSAMKPCSRRIRRRPSPWVSRWHMVPGRNEHDAE